MSNNRKSIGTKIRFEVFKRDSFTCQYCGKSAPDVILEVDHINAVKNGGDNNIMNLITSCIDCNRGKGARELSDKAVIKLEKEKLNELNERRRQMEEMLKWREELINLDDEKVSKIENIIKLTMKVSLTDHGRDDIRKLIKTYGFNEVLESLDIAFDKYFKSIDDAENVLSSIVKICKMRKMDKADPLLKDKMYISGILRNRFNITQYEDLKIREYLHKYCISKERAEEIKEIAKYISYKSHFIEQLLNKYGGDQE